MKSFCTWQDENNLKSYIEAQINIKTFVNSKD